LWIYLLIWAHPRYAGTGLYGAPLSLRPRLRHGCADPPGLTHPSNPLRGALWGGILEKTRRLFLKKFMVFVVFSMGISSAAFSLSESSLALGFGWGQSFESISSGRQKIKTYLSAPGITCNNYGFWNKGNSGIFSSMGFFFPDKGTSSANGNETTADFSVYDILFQFNAVIGPGFRFAFSKNLALQFGVGLNYLQTTASRKGHALFVFNLGFGGDIGIKYDITDSFFLRVGSALSYDLANHTAIYTSSGDDTAGWIDGYSMIGVRPYLCIGINTWSEGSFFNRKSGFGKPE
jgi:hypothetical protein